MHETRLPDETREKRACGRFIGATRTIIHTHIITLSTPCDPGLVLTTFTCASAFAAVFPAAISAPGAAAGWRVRGRRCACGEEG